MTTATAARVQLVLLALEARQLAGVAPAPGQITSEYLARLSEEIAAPVSANTWRTIERSALAKIALALSTRKNRQTEKP